MPHPCFNSAVFKSLDPVGLFFKSGVLKETTNFLPPTTPRLPLSGPFQSFHLEAGTLNFSKPGISGSSKSNQRIGASAFTQQVGPVRLGQDWRSICCSECVCSNPVCVSLPQLGPPVVPFLPFLCWLGGFLTKIDVLKKYRVPNYSNMEASRTP